MFYVLKGLKKVLPSLGLLRCLWQVALIFPALNKLSQIVISSSEPASAREFPRDYMERVKKVHSEGGYGSQG